MNMKTILMIALAATLGGSVLWIVTDCAVAEDTATASRKVLYYTCPMHPSVKAEQPGACPICGMTLQPVYAKTTGTNSPPAVVSSNKPAAVPPSCCSMASGGCCQ